MRTSLSRLQTLGAWALAALLSTSTARAATDPSPARPLRFERACEPSSAQLIIAHVGDVLLHTPLQRAAQAHAAQGGFADLWAGVQPWLALADLRYANLEGPVARSYSTSSYPQFNYAPSLIPDLVRSRFDIVSTANNHALDKTSRGVDETIEALEQGHLPYTGTRRAQDRTTPWHAFTEKNGFKLAWVACTFSTNGISDAKDQVLHCYEDEREVLSTIERLKNTPGVDAVFVTPHWGIEYKHAPEARERALGKRFLEAGALAVIGSHPHVLQPWEKHTIRGEEKFIIYSLGNFVSGQGGAAKRASTVVYLGLSKNSSGAVWINGVRNLPLTMTFRGKEMGVVPSQTVAGREGGPSLAINRMLYADGNEVKLDELSRLRTNPECAR